MMGEGHYAICCIDTQLLMQPEGKPRPFEQAKVIGEQTRAFSEAMLMDMRKAEIPLEGGTIRVIIQFIPEPWEKVHERSPEILIVDQGPTA